MTASSLLLALQDNILYRMYVVPVGRFYLSVLCDMYNNNAMYIHVE